MFARRLFAALAVVAALSVSFASHAANAQNAAAGTCADPGYITLFGNTGAAMKSVDLTKSSSVGAALLVLIQARYQFEDTIPPAGCEAAKPVLIQFLATEEDSLYISQAVLADTANKAAYVEIANTAASRLATIGTAVSAAFASTAAASAAPVATMSAAPQVCSDATFVAQVKTDSTSLGSLSGMNISPLIKLRYKYEDLTASAGCEDARTLLLQAFSIAEDQVALAVLAQADTANASSYTDFVKNTISPRNAVLQKNGLIAMPGLAPTAAATASS